MTHPAIRRMLVAGALTLMLAACDTTLHHPVNGDGGVSDSSGGDGTPDLTDDADGSQGTSAGPGDDTHTPQDSTGFTDDSDTSDGLPGDSDSGVTDDADSGTGHTGGTDADADSDGDIDSGTGPEDLCAEEEERWGAVGSTCGGCGIWQCSEDGLHSCGADASSPESCTVQERCGGLGCEAMGRSCDVDEGLDQVWCGACPAGTREDDALACIDLLTCEQLDCEVLERRRCEEDGVADAVCADCLPGYSASGPGRCVWEEDEDGMILVEAAALNRVTVGSPPGEWGRVDESEGQWEVFLTYDYWLDAVPVLQHQWQAVFGQTPSRNEDCPLCPVENITWWSVLSYANGRSELAGASMCYNLPAGCTGRAAEGTLNCGTPASSLLPGRYNECDGYRLPSEVEWEIAVRAGTSAATWAGDLPAPDDCEPGTILDDIAWTCANTAYTQPAWMTHPNPWGFFDMLGSVYEMTADAFVDAPGGDSSGLGGVMNPWHTPVGRSRIAVRGGSFDSDLSEVRSAARRDTQLTTRSGSIGFRLARTVIP